ncbi:DUF1501 domain-containing protein [Okeanomitos corallinicola TIOX110]|uniref:DUF1501 domain-containing protein n=1 Tax=Okeanomitos corallinicola TIOX110 TaxID=3133117 RepID=A0ABZ2UT45_9CYAN
MKRRDFLIQTGLFSTSLITAIGSNAWIAHSATAKNNPQRLIVIFLRGGVDGLNIVVPYTETAYYQARPKIAIPQPGKTGGVIDLDGRFGLHPALSSLTPLWQKNTLAFVHACGLNDPTRSHFDAQKYMESGTPGNKGTRDGWMNRLLGVIAKKTPVQAVTVGSNTPWILYGQMPIANLPTRGNPKKRFAIDRPQVATAFDQLYSGKDSLSQTYIQGRMAREAIMKDLNEEMKMADNGAPLPTGFAKDANRLAKLMAKDPRIELGFMALGGWDTHAAQGSSQGKLAQNLESLGTGLTALVAGLGSVYQDTTIVVMSEFGRTFQQNNNGGTDHGHGNVMWVLGGKVKGGKVYGDWPGLAPNQLYQQRDLEVTTDFRDVIFPILQSHLKINSSQISQILPNYKPIQKIALI